MQATERQRVRDREAKWRDRRKRDLLKKKKTKSKGKENCKFLCWNNERQIASASMTMNALIIVGVFVENEKEQSEEKKNGIWKFPSGVGKMEWAS